MEGDLVASDEVITETIRRAKSVEDTARCLRLRSRNKFASKDFAGALEDTLSALETLGVIVNPSPSRKEVDIMFEQVKNEILAVGFENILKIPRTDNPRIDLTVQLLNDAGMLSRIRRTKVISLAESSVIRHERLLEYWRWLFGCPWSYRE